MKFEGKVALITGAVGGIGTATSLKLAREGAKVALLDIDEASMKQLALRGATRSPSDVRRRTATAPTDQAARGRA